MGHLFYGNDDYLSNKFTQAWQFRWLIASRKIGKEWKMAVLTIKSIITVSSLAFCCLHALSTAICVGSCIERDARTMAGLDAFRVTDRPVGPGWPAAGCKRKDF